jgi:hypothetical protein
MISPFFFPVEAESFNFVRPLYTILAPINCLQSAGLRYLWFGHHFRHLELVFHSRREVAQQAAGDASIARS